MRIHITAVERRGSDTWVTFTAEVGTGRGRWRSPEVPSPGDQQHVELDFPEPVREFRVLPAGTAASLARDGDVVTVTAHVLASGSAPDDPVATVSVGGDIVLLELDAPAGDCIAFTARAVDLFPYNL